MKGRSLSRMPWTLELLPQGTQREAPRDQNLRSPRRGRHSDFSYQAEVSVVEGASLLRQRTHGEARSHSRGTSETTARSLVHAPPGSTLTWHPISCSVDCETDFRRRSTLMASSGFMIRPVIRSARSMRTAPPARFSNRPATPIGRVSPERHRPPESSYARLHLPCLRFPRFDAAAAQSKRWRVLRNLSVVRVPIRRVGRRSRSDIRRLARPMDCRGDALGSRSVAAPGELGSSRAVATPPARRRKLSGAHQRSHCRSADGPDQV